MVAHCNILYFQKYSCSYVFSTVFISWSVFSDPIKYLLFIYCCIVYIYCFALIWSIYPVNKLSQWSIFQLVIYIFVLVLGTFRRSDATPVWNGTVQQVGRRSDFTGNSPGEGAMHSNFSITFNLIAVPIRRIKCEYLIGAYYGNDFIYLYEVKYKKSGSVSKHTLFSQLLA